MVKVNFAPLRRPIHTELQEPAFPVGVEEGVRQIVPVVLWDFEGLVFDAVVKILHRERVVVQGKPVN